MRQSIVIGLLTLFMLSMAPSMAQHKFKMNPYFKGRYKDIKIPKTKLRFICPGYTGGGYPYQGIGVKLGDPIAITYKLYISKRFSFVLDYGRTATGLYETFHKDNFLNVQQPDTLGVGESLKYFGHTGKKDGIVAGKLLYRFAFRQIDGLQWYLGVGAQYRWTDVQYTYIETVPNTPNKLKSYSINYFTLGPAGTIGIEYSHPDIPISSFFELDTYYDTWNYPGWIRISAGVGLRYIL